MLRWGLLGTSFISDTMAVAIQNSPGSAVTAVAGRHLGRLDEFANRHSIATRHADFADLCADPEVDIVYVGLPNHIHHTYSLLAARHGKHVLCEKSLSVDMEKTDELLSGVAEAGHFFVEGLMYRAHPVVARFADLLTSGRLGALRLVSALYAADIARFVNPDGRGVIYNLGCYPVSLLQLVLSVSGGDFSDRRLQAFGQVSATDGNICDAVAAIRFGNGVLATVSTSETHGMAHEFTVTGQLASARFQTNPWLPIAGDNVIEIIDHESGAVTETIVVNSGLDAFDHQVRMAEAAIADGATEAPFPSPGRADSRAIMGFLTDWEMACKAALG